MLLLKNGVEVIFELLPPRITGARDRNAVAVPRGCVFLDVVLHVIVVNVVWLVSEVEMRLDERCSRCAHAGMEFWRRVAPYFMMLMMGL